VTEDLVSLVRRFQGGDIQAFEALVDRFSGPLSRFVGHLTPDRALAEDLLQGLWIKAWTHREALQDPAKIRSWLYRVAHREFLMHLRAQGEAPAGSEEMDELPGAEESPAELLVREEDAGKVMEGFHRLPAFQKEVVWLSVVEGIGHGEIARILGIPEGTCRSRLHHALARLQEDLKIR